MQPTLRVEAGRQTWHAVPRCNGAAARTLARPSQKPMLSAHKASPVGNHEATMSLASDHPPSGGKPIPVQKSTADSAAARRQARPSGPSKGKRSVEVVTAPSGDLD